MLAGQNLALSALRLRFWLLGPLCGIALWGQSTASHGDACVVLQRVILEASTVRALPLKRTVRCRALPSAALASEFEKASETPVDAASIENEEIVYRKLGLIPPEYPYAQCARRALSKHAIAFYNLRSHEMLLPSDRPLSPSLLAHEAVHALQDQYFDMAKLRRAAGLSSDTSAAVAALVEGDAMLVEKLYAENHVTQTPPAKEETPGATPELDSDCALPAALQLLYGFPYDYGAIFAERLYRAGGMERLDAAYRNPPQASTHIMRSRDYVSLPPGRATRFPELRASPIPGAESRFSDVLGQFTIQTLLKNFMNPKSAVSLALGWRGDRVTLSRLRDASLQLRWQSRWQDERAARAFATALVQTLAARFNLHLALTTSVQFMTADNQFWSVQQQRNRVTIESRWPEERRT